MKSLNDKLPELLPNIIVDLVSSYLEPPAAATTLGRTSHFFNVQNNRFNKMSCFWKPLLLKLGCSEAALAEMINLLPPPESYQNLYLSRLRVNPALRTVITNCWELMCLTGNVEAVSLALKNSLLTLNTMTTHQETTLHLAAWSGSASLMQFIIPQLSASQLLTLTEFENSVLHYAALSGNPDAVNVALRIPGINLRTKNITGSNAFHLAVQTGNIDSIELLSQTALHQEDVMHEIAGHIYHLAVRSNNPQAVIVCRRLNALNLLNLDSNLKDAQGLTPIDWADRGKQPAAMKAALEMPIDEILRDTYPFTTLSATRT